jgi:glutamate dehydrogenase
MSPPELLRAILKAPVDLLWNGGIGTYVKASTETHAEVGDKGNDSIRVDGADLRAKVVGEGGNLGLTQLGRIEYALAGGHINTDAIDNSAGVDTSDHEVNIKILLDQVVREGRMDMAGRNALLVEMTDDVARQVLRHNYEQNVLLGNARVQAPAMLSVHKRFIRALEERGELDRALEFLPSATMIDQRLSAGLGLTSSELAVLAAYAKITLTATILDTPLPDEAWFGAALRPLLPGSAGREVRRPARPASAAPRDHLDLGDQRHGQPRRHLVRLPRPGGDRGEPAADRPGLHARTRGVPPRRPVGRDRVARQQAAHRRPVDALPRGSPAARPAAPAGCCRVARRASTSQPKVHHFQAGLDGLLPRVPEFLVGAEQRRPARPGGRVHRARRAPRIWRCARQDCSTRSRCSTSSRSRAAEKRPAGEVAAIYFAISERIEVDQMLTRITDLPRGDRWTALARSALRYDLYAALAGLTTNVLTSTSSSEPAQVRIEAWEEANHEGVTRARSTSRRSPPRTTSTSPPCRWPCGRSAPCSARDPTRCQPRLT